MKKYSKNEQESACTTIMVGSKMMADGSRIYARSDDAKEYKATTLMYYHHEENGPNEFEAFDSPFYCDDLPKVRLAYSALERPYLPGHWGEAGFNELGVGMSATETIFSNEKVLAIDPYVENGVAENCIFNIVLPYIDSARNGVKRLGSLIEKYGSAEGFGIAFMDQKETWYLENAGGHRWLACRMPEDKYFVSGNQSRYRKYEPKDKHNYLASKDLIEFAVKNGLCTEDNFDFHTAYSLESDNDKTYNYPRVWALQKLFTPSVKTNVKVNDFPVYQTADKLLTVTDIRNAFRYHYDGTQHDPYLHSNPKEPYRPVSIFRTINTHILQVRPWLPKEIGCLDYMAMGMADLGLFLPLYQGVTDYPEPYMIGETYSTSDSAYWTFRKVMVLGMMDYNNCAPIIKEVYGQLERENDQRQAEMEIEFQRLYDNNQPIRAMEMLQEFSDKLLMHALDVSKDLLEILFTKLTSKIGQEYRFHGA